MAHPSADYRTFFARKPRGHRVIKTIEIYCASIGLLRYCSGLSNEDLALEAGAPRDAGQSVTFTGVNLDYSFPQQSDQDAILIPVTIPRIGTDGRRLVRDITTLDAFNGIEVVLRSYITSDITTPQDVWYLYDQEESISGDTITINATDKNPAKTNTARLYTFEDFPALREAQ